MEPKPTALIVSNSNTKPTSIIKLITKQPTNSNDISGNTIIQPWSIKTKYYTTEIHLIGFNDSIDKLNIDAAYINTIEAIIIHMDSNKTTSLEDINKWAELMNELSIQPEIKILLANYCNDKTVISKDDANLWCLDKGFEFVELFPTLTDIEIGEDNEDSFGAEKVGVERVIEALENNLWSNMDMTESNNEESNNHEAETDQFIELFSNLMTMKSSITSLPSNVKKQYAEQMVTAFWKAIGGDDEEIADL